MWKEFKAFAFKGNVIDLAVGVMIGAAFGAIVTSVVNDIFMGEQMGEQYFKGHLWLRSMVHGHAYVLSVRNK